MKNVVLFDMDGTITPARQSIEPEVEQALLRLSGVADIGIVTGSGLDYVLQQCKTLLKSHYDMSNFSILPCNGTQKYTWNKQGWENGYWEEDFSLDMRKEVGEETFRRLMFLLLERMYITHLAHKQKIPTTGHFITYRGSLINWCPIGRLATDSDRKSFVDYEKKNAVRKKNIEVFERTDLKDIFRFSLGGSTSIDIYPIGWDKTYALTHYVGRDCWFIGDRCTDEYGNDKLLYDKIRETNVDRSFEVKSTSETIEIINNLIGEFSAQ